MLVLGIQEVPAHLDDAFGTDAGLDVQTFKRVITCRLQTLVIGLVDAQKHAVRLKECQDTVLEGLLRICRNKSSRILHRQSNSARIDLVLAGDHGDEFRRQLALAILLFQAVFPNVDTSFRKQFVEEHRVIKTTTGGLGYGVLL